MIEIDLRNQLKNNLDVSNLVGTRIYPKVAPQNAPTPYIVYSFINNNNEQCIGGAIYQKDSRVQIDCWSKQYSKSIKVREAVVNALVGFKSSNSINTNDDYEADTELYREIIDIKLKD